MNVLKMKSPTTAQVVINSFKLQCLKNAQVCLSLGCLKNAQVFLSLGCLKNAQVCLSLGCRAQVFLSLGCGIVALMVLFLCHSLWLQI